MMRGDWTWWDGTWWRLFECLGYRQGYLQSLIEGGAIEVRWLLSADLFDSSEGIVTLRDESGIVDASCQ